MENNKLIAEFMDYENVDEMFPFDGELHYHTSWDWLIPVVESCLERLDARDTSADEIKRQLLCCHLEGVYAKVVEFIKGYPHPPYTDLEGNTYI